ncbi:Fur family transcriptional regulator [Clostridium sediminicola]|uniref:Fur family transcriptional regulator n=1 Tax=Clostridium sediminicola TaxID=3114879 RepID=UPI003D16A9FA
MIIKNGFKMTFQRRLILKELFYSNKHMKAEELFNRVKSKNIGLATVYRTLKILTDLNIIKEMSIDDVNYYEMKLFSKKSLHIHMKCLKCGRIVDIDDEEIIYNYLRLNISLEKKYEIEIKDTNLVFQGICKSCKEKENA